jgi:hypothetical protein
MIMAGCNNKYDKVELFTSYQYTALVGTSSRKLNAKFLSCLRAGRSRLAEEYGSGGINRAWTESPVSGRLG